MSKNLEEIVCLESEKREEWIQEVRERLQGNAQGASSAPHLASSSAALFTRKKSVQGSIVVDRTGEEKIQFLPDLPQSLRKKERWRRGHGGED